MGNLAKTNLLSGRVCVCLSKRVGLGLDEISLNRALIGRQIGDFIQSKPNYCILLLKLTIVCKLYEWDANAGEIHHKVALGKPSPEVFLTSISMWDPLLKIDSNSFLERFRARKSTFEKFPSHFFRIQGGGTPLNLFW